ncbi:fasciclin domain-containing protein [Allocoleopsis franciscana]|uniref:Secreted/surface protein with fasciclin-like repeats n=1 Tax=Allocoleopsis franciscana PCC 7113 TaxID=1173027 RepID=K9WID8_9CYAN|nr:fasciclin domain-containing protein [Allocoleopsis franciscana]AFZ19544.1 secreted/surface protein with fasciclin-like repeats [Allocoleopsis franciscana PCC 7113]
MDRLTKTVKKVAAIAGAASALVTLPVLAQNMPTGSMQTQPPTMRTQPQDQSKPMTPSASPTKTSTTASGNVVDVAAANGSFKTLTAALKAAGLDKALASEGPFTIFAPTDEAFAALPEGTVEELLKPENRDTLIAILTYHVVPGENTSKTLKSGEAETLEGAAVEVKVSSNGVMVNDANVVKADIPASNGVIHVIDKVIMPPVDPPSKTSGSSVR